MSRHLHDQILKGVKRYLQWMGMHERSLRSNRVKRLLTHWQWRDQSQKEESSMSMDFSFRKRKQTTTLACAQLQCIISHRFCLRSQLDTPALQCLIYRFETVWWTLMHTLFMPSSLPSSKEIIQYRNQTRFAIWKHKSNKQKVCYFYPSDETSVAWIEALMSLQCIAEGSRSRIPRVPRIFVSIYK